MVRSRICKRSQWVSAHHPMQTRTDLEEYVLGRERIFARFGPNFARCAVQRGASRGSIRGAGRP